MSDNLTTAAKVLEALGGAEGVAVITGSDRKAVYNWKYFDAFPAHTYLSITTELERRGKRAPVSLWRKMSPPRKPVANGGGSKKRRASR